MRTSRSNLFLFGPAILLICVLPSCGASLTGVTLDEVVDARLGDVSISLFSNDRYWQTRSDHEGRFTISGLPAGRYSIETRRTGFKKAIVNDIPLAGDESRTLTLKLRICSTGCDEGCGPDLIHYEARGNGDRLLATVLSEGKPVAGAELALRSPHSVVPPRAITDTGGGAELDNIPPGQYVLSISASRYQSTEVSDVRLLAHRASIVTINLLRNGMIRVCQ